ncbi:AAA family ATPase [Candidatus Parabeggiatoa sp. HSG14]|uniref:AAA family ATPase n=1 Tax=Candidatus Parabeggiatoa sp. HSG14 TaxID=3055593 RepID=UPI0025A8D885|nr:AAA family ATPase [Thiotrichales bacterium HSG14]
MPIVPLEFPVLVSPSQTEGYHLRPLFLDNPNRSARRFRDAVDLLTKDMRRLFRTFATERKTIDDLLWFAFNPKLKFELIPLDFSFGQQKIFGTFAVVRFPLKDHQFLCLPAFDNTFAIVNEKTAERATFIEQLIDVICDQLREQRKRYPDEFSPNDYYANGSEFLTTISLSVNVKRAQFPFEKRVDGWFASLAGQQQEFFGATELARVGSNLRDGYPHHLRRASLRDESVERLGKLIFGQTMTAVVIVGPPGCGRTTLLHETFFRYLQEQETKPKSRAATLWHIDPNRIIAGMSIVGMWQRRFESILEYVIHGNPKNALPIARPRLFIDNLVALFRIGKSAQNSLTLSDVLKPYMEQRQLTLIAEASPEEWNVVMETDRRFADLCQVIRLNEPNMASTAHIALLERARLEQKHECEIDNEAMERVFALTHSLLKNTAMPGNIVDFLERLAAKYRYGFVSVEEVEEAVSEITHMTSDLLDRKKTLHKKEVEKALSTKLIGQPNAINCLVDVVQTIKSGLQDPKKPMATLLFIGPTGVGKTQAAKVLTHYLFTDESQLIRLDMNEFVTEADVGRLIGNWSRPDGLLTTRVRHQPFCVLLLDEIEKAHPAIHDLLLQVLGEGRLTDTLGSTTDFTNTIIIMTSNLGAEQAGRKMGFVEKDAQNQASGYRAAVEDFFRPELLNRIDRMVVFKSLELQDAVAITRLQLEDLLQRDGFVRRTTILNIFEKALVEVAQRGFDAVLGGRALKRAIERDLTALAATQLVDLTANQPILLDIDWNNGGLQPRITALQPISQEKILPSQLEQALSLKSVNILFEITSNLRDRLYGLRDTQGIALEASTEKMRFLLTMQESIFEVMEQLDEIRWALEIARDPTETRFTTQRQQAHFNFSQTKEQYINSADFYAHQEIRDYLEEMYVLAPKLIRESSSYWLNLLMNATFLNFFCQGLELNQYEMLTLTLQSRVRGSGQEELNYLSNGYEKGLAYMGIEVTRYPVDDSNKCHLKLKGPCLQTLLAGEKGIHLFHPPNENAIPIQVSFDLLNEEVQVPKLQIIRSYALPADDGKAGVLTDLRTGMMNRTELKVHEWALLWYAQLSEEKRLNLDVIAFPD